MADPAQRLIASALRLREAIARVPVGAPVTHIYNPLEYAWEPHRCYLERFGGRGATVLLLGMNPGPFGMAQSGVPFGDIGMVRDWLGINGRIKRPDHEHPKRPVSGFDCRRGEVSGQRLWGWARDAYGTPALFFDRFFVWNYCPLAFMEASGRNVTPDKLPAATRKLLYEPCNHALREVVGCIAATHVVGIGRFAFDRAVAALEETPVMFGCGPHPSPANPAANRDWSAQFETALRGLGVLFR